MSLLGIIFIGIALFCVVAALKRVWPHVPLLPGLFEDMNNGWSYDKKGNRLDHGPKSRYDRNS